MDVFILLVQFVLIIVLLSYISGMKRALWRVEKEQNSAKTRQQRIAKLIEALLNKRPKTPSQDASHSTSAEQSAPAVAQPPAVPSGVKIDLSQSTVAFAEKLKKPQTPLLKQEHKAAPAPHRAPIEPPAVSPIVANAREMLARIWSWILVGEEHRSGDMSMEYAIASTWLLRAGIIAIVAFVVFFLKWSIEKELMGPTARVALSILFGAGMVISGLRLLGKKYHLMGQGFLGGGILILYFSVYAAGPLYHIVTTPLAFGLMILVTTAAWLIAIRVNSMLVAILGIAGGFMTPVLLSTGSANLPVLYSYMLLLNLGILAVSHSRRWPLLNYLGFILTYAIFVGSLDAYKQSDFFLTIMFLSAFFVIHSVIVYLYNIQRRHASNALEIIHLIANACLYGAIAYFLISEAHGGRYPAILSVGMATFYIGHVAVFLRRKLNDRGLLVALIALAGAFTTWTLPLLFEKESLTISFALLAVTLLWIGKRIGSKFMENLSHALYCVVFLRLFGELHRNFGGLAVTRGAEYWSMLVERLWTFGISIGSIASAFVLENRQSKTAPLVAASSDTGRLLPVSTGAPLFYWTTIVFLFLFLHFEINAMFGMWDAFRLPALTVTWCIIGGYFLFKACRCNTPNTVMLVALTALVCASFLKIMTYDIVAWEFCESGYYNMAYTGQSVFARMLDFGSVLLLIGLAWAWLPACYPKPTKAAFGYAGLAFLFMYTTFEFNSLLHWKLNAFQAGGITALWALFAIAFTSSGIWRNIRPLRYMGLILFAIVAGKVFLFDLSEMPMIFRMVAFLVVGVALLLGSFAYLFANKKFMIETKPE